MPVNYYELKSPAAVQTELTPRCNHKCRYCYNAWRGNHQYEPELGLKEHLDIAREVVDSEVFENVLTGGEPLLRRDVLYPVANFLAKNGVDVKINTNLSLINEEDCKRLKNNGVIGVMGSFPSFDEETFNYITQTKNFKKAIKGIEVLVKYGIPPAINMVVIQQNKDHVYQTGKMAYEMGAKGFCGTPVSPATYLDKSFELTPKETIQTLDDLLKLNEEFGISVDIVEPLPRCLFKDVKKYRTFLKKDCAAGKLTSVISSSGQVRPCTHVPKSYGNIIKEPLPVIWRRMREWRNGSMTPSRCSICPEDIVCSKGCREAANIRKGDYKEIDPLIETLTPPNKLRFVSNEERKVNPVQEYIFNDISLRSERDGYLLFCKTTYTMALVNEGFLNFIKGLKAIEPFSINKIILEKGAKPLDKIEEAFQLLVQRDFIKEYKE